MSDSDHTGGSAPGAPTPGATVRAKAALVDPATLSVLWSNEVAEQGALACTLEQTIPLAESMGVPAAVALAAQTGVPQHLRTSLVSTGRGDMEIATSVYRLPDNTVLVLSENAWQPREGRRASGPPRRKR